ncbi:MULTISPECIES: VOC family protein [unclassified Inquilinus]|uniref:VOC family protein n=1 Tax=unclassified Inquilinus TaxID=2645927 RepID=UPI003F93BF5F
MVPMPPIKRIAEVVFETPDLQASIRFYRDVLGLDLSESDDNSAWFRFGDQLVAFFHSSFVGPTGDEPHTTFEIERADLGKAITWLGSSNIEIRAQRIFDDGAVGLFITDPNGKTLEIYCRNS